MTAKCTPGAYCPTRSSTPYPITCPSGWQCPLGARLPQPCLPGFYTNTSGQSSCLVCPAGFYCLPLVWKENLPPNETIGYKKCPPGYYCPSQTGSNWKPCPAGTYSNSTGLSEVAQCVSCSPGEYCVGDLLTRSNGICDPGYYCRIGKLTFTF